MNDQLIECTVDMVNPRLDVVYLIANEQFVVEPVTVDIKSSYEGELYIHLGFSNTTQNQSPLSTTVANISSSRPDCDGHILGSVGSNPGDSGGPVFSFLSGELLGMLVGCSYNPKQVLGLNALKSTIVPIFMLVKY